MSAGRSGSSRDFQGVQKVAGGVQLNFDGAEVREVVDVILGQALGASYTIDPVISGQVVLSSAGPLDADELLSVLEAVLASQGAALVDLGGSYAVQLAQEAGGRADFVTLGGNAAPRVGPGAGITVVPLRFMSATAAAQFVQPLVSQPEQIRIDETRNLLIFAGTSVERQNVVDTLADIDVNWMAGRSVGVFPLRMATPEALIPELEALFAPLSAPELGTETIRFLPMARLNAVIAIANEAEQIVEVERWVARLDRGNTVGVQFYVYQLQYAPAEELAAILAESFAGISDHDQNGAAESPLENIEPSQPPVEGQATTLVGSSSHNLGSVKIVPNALNNTLLIRATPQAYEMVEATLRRLDTAPLQVIIEATIAEVTLNDQLRYGVQYFFDSGSFRGGFNSSTITTSGVTDPANLNPLARLPGFNFFFTPGNSAIAIDALSRITDVKVLSSPSVVVQDNTEAMLNVGDQVPIITRTAQSVENVDAPIVSNIEYRDTGVILEVKPRISSNDVVSLEISQEVSRVSTETATQSDIPSPTISQRKITSQININSGQTVVLGGLIQDSETRSRDKIPLLGDIPGLGELFQSTNNQAGRTELIVFITPRIIKNAEDARDVSEELRSRMRSIRPLAPATRETIAPAPEPLLPPADIDLPNSSGSTPTQDGAVIGSSPASDTGEEQTPPRRIDVPEVRFDLAQAPVPSVRPFSGNSFVPRARP